MLRGSHLEIDAPARRFSWGGGLDTLNFDVTAADDAPEETVVVKYDVVVAGVRVAALRHDLEIRRGAGVAGTRKTSARPARTAFASYASEDRQRVLDRIAGLKIGVGLDIFQECLSLRPGEKWKPALQKEIHDRDLFLLFWSRRAATSPWVEWEWTTALDAKGEEGLQLHPLEPADMSPIPERLKHLHFNDACMIVRAYYERQAGGRHRPKGKPS